VDSRGPLACATLPLRAAATIRAPFSPAAAEYRFWFVDRLHERLVEQHGSLRFNLKSECAGVGQKASTASEQFKRRYAATIRDYGLRLRMEYARARIDRDPTLHLADLASELGYSRENAFSRVFSSYWKMSPRDWAQRAVVIACEPALSAGASQRKPEQFSSQARGSKSAHNGIV
jgi:AraC-like DNA-binding protein